MENNIQNKEINGTHNESQYIFHNLSESNYKNTFFHTFNDHDCLSAENNSNYLNFQPPFESQQNIQVSDPNSMFNNNPNNTNFSSLFYPPFEDPPRVNFSNLMNNNEIVQPQYQQYNHSSDLTLSTARPEICNSKTDSNNTSLVTLFQKAIANPEEKNALMKLFRQINVLDSEERSVESQNRMHYNSNMDAYPLYNIKTQENYGYPPQSHNPQGSTYSDFGQLSSNFPNMTANANELAYVTSSNAPAKCETYNGSKIQNVSDEVVIPNIVRGSYEYPRNSSPLIPDSEAFDTVAQTSDSQYAESRSAEDSSPLIHKKYSNYVQKDRKAKSIRKLNYQIRKNTRRHSSMNITSQSDTSSMSRNHSRRKRRSNTNNVKMIDAKTIPSLFTKFPKYVGILHLKNVLQPDMYHRARYLTEGSRTTLRDLSGSSYPTVKLAGFECDGAKLHVFIGVDGNPGMPSLFYQISRASFKTSTSPREITVDGINALEYDFVPDQNMTVILDGIGILKLRNSDVEHRFGVKTRKKTSKCCLTYRAIVPYGDLGYTVIQTRSNPITCVQPMGNPEITRVIPPSAFPGNELAIIGKNFLKNAFVLFYDKIIEAENPSGKKYSWSVQAVIDSDLSNPMHIVCKVPFYPEEYARANGSTILNLLVRCNNRSSQTVLFSYKNPNCTN